MTSTTIGMVLFPQVTHLDFTGPFEVFGRVPGARVLALAATLAPVTSDTGLRILPDETFDSAPDLDILCVPGGPGINAMLDDQAFLGFLRRQGERARFVTSVCSGSLLLGAAGLLSGYRAASHWMSREFLPAFGAIPDEGRVVVDRNRITGGGVTAGIDFGLVLAGMLVGEEAARRIQLMLEYNPAPPFDAGSPEQAGAQLATAVRTEAARYLDDRRTRVARAAARL